MLEVLDTRVPIFNYSDYRGFIKEYIGALKNKDTKYSYSYFSGLINGSETYLKQVVSGRRKISIEKAAKLAEKIKLNEIESSYFFMMVLKDNSEDKDVKLNFERFRKDIKLLVPNEYKDGDESIFKSILTWEIYTLLGLKDSKLKFDWIFARLRDDYSEEEVKGAIKKLRELNIFKKSLNDVFLKTGVNTEGLYITALERATKHLEMDNGLKCGKFDSFCLIHDKESQTEIEKILEDAKQKVISISKNSVKKDKASFLNINFFPISK